MVPPLLAVPFPTARNWYLLLCIGITCFFVFSLRQPVFPRGDDLNCVIGTAMDWKLIIKLKVFLCFEPLIK
jgi:hypothetical protein